MFLELEITNRCPLECRHCYAESGPNGTHGTLSTAEWQSVLTDASTCGVDRVQLIGGEPTAHPDFEWLVEHALDAGLKVEIFTNLSFHVKAAWWDLFARPGVTLATSYYSDEAADHEWVTGRR